ncbi:hypothetical protein M3P21_14740 [Ruegeria sp. 2012CJ41-6]|uniref:Uncharacterized protein n=1 Tax=Ruegeria spongiae TaxID=2942209 RepID=A0ABT0Q4K1_9RHOB|nr:hypothetical protein [Ruegeria spongiae]MCL6284791.1 hypothetical protein [Ruegeria spongiae]
MNQLRLSIVTGALLLANGAFAGQTVYDCEIGSQEKYGWISERMVFLVDDADQSVMVIDAIVKHVKGGPIPATVRSVKNGKYKLKWTLRNIEARQGSYTGKYSATLDTSKAKVSTRASISGTDNRPSGHGKCKISKNK